KQKQKPNLELCFQLFDFIFLFFYFLSRLAPLLFKIGRFAVFHFNLIFCGLREKAKKKVNKEDRQRGQTKRTNKEKQRRRVREKEEKMEDREGKKEEKVANLN